MPHPTAGPTSDIMSAKMNAYVCARHLELAQILLLLLAAARQLLLATVATPPPPPLSIAARVE